MAQLLDETVLISKRGTFMELTTQASFQSDLDLLNSYSWLVS